MEYFGKSRNGDYRRSQKPNAEYFTDNPRRGEHQNFRQTTLGNTFDNLTGNGEEISQRTRSVEGTVNGSGPNGLPIGTSNVYYGYGGPFRLDYETDGSSEPDSSWDFKIQPWMDKITGGTFKKNYTDKISFRPSLHHDPQRRIGDIPQFRREASEPDAKGNKSRTLVIIFSIILGIILIGGIAGVLAYFLSQNDNGDSSIKYYVATGEMSLDEVFYEELSNSSSQEFKNLSSKFCGAITEALQKNSTENGDKYRLCEVIDFSNGSIIVRFKVYYLFTATVPITAETVQKDLNSSLTSTTDANLAQLSTLVIIKMTVKITIEIETFQKENDPVATNLSPSTSPVTTTESTISTAPSTDVTTPTTATTVITNTTKTTAPTTATTTTSTTTPTTTITTTETTTSTITTTRTATTTPTATTRTATTTPTATTRTATTTPTATSAPTTTNKPSATTTTTAAPTPTATTTTTGTTTTTAEYITTPVTSRTDRTTSSERSTTIRDSTAKDTSTTATTTATTENTGDIETPTISSDISTDMSTERLTQPTTTTEGTAESTVQVTTKTIETSTESTKPTTTRTGENTTYIATSTDRTTLSTTIITESTPSTSTSAVATIYKSTTENEFPTTLTRSTESTTESSSPTVPVKNTAESTTGNATPTTATTVESTSESTTDNASPTTATTVETVDSTTDSTTQTIQTTSWPQQSTKCDGCTPESTVDGTTSESITNDTIATTRETTSAAPLEYTADVRVPSIIATVGEISTVQICRVTPHGDWLYLSVSIDYNGTPHVIEKLHYNKTAEKPAIVERFNSSIGMNGDDIIVTMTSNLTAPTADICSWDGRYAVSCSLTMNDTAQTKKSNGSRIFITAPLSEISIDSNLHYDEGDQLTFNCSTKLDPNYSDVYVEFFKDSTSLGDMSAPGFGSGKNNDCSVDFNWAASTNRLTPKENGVIVRCVVTNTLLNNTKFAEKKLNVSAADVGFTRYSYRNLTKSFQEIECIARSASSVLHNLTISKDGVEIAVENSSDTAIKLISSTRHSATTQTYNGDVRLIVRISGVECEDQGIYRCTMLKTDNSTTTSPNMSFIVEGATPTLTLNPDIFEPFARKDFNHSCSTEHTGDGSSHKYLEVQVFKLNAVNSFKYSSKTPESEKNFDPEDKLTYINITGTTAQFLLVSNQKVHSSCNNEETITFLLDLTMEFNNGIIKCVLTDGMNEYASVESRITVIPGNYCDEYEHGSIRKHPNNECSNYVDCISYKGVMYAVGNSCPTSHCIEFATKSCVPCDKTFTCEELTTTGPTTPMITLPPGTNYVSCNDSTYSVGTTATVKCVVLDKGFTSLNISFFSESSPGTEEIMGQVLSDGTIQSQPRSDVTFSTNFSSSPMILLIIFQTVNCNQKGQYKIIARGTNSSFSPSVETFHINVIGNLTAFEMHTRNIYEEGTVIEINCTASLDETHAIIKGFYKRQTESTFTDIKGSTAITERNSSHCFVKAIWKPTNPMTADVSLNNTELKCEISKWPYASLTRTIIVTSADVAFNTYKIESNIGNPVSASCIARNVNFLKGILIRKIETSGNVTVASISFPNTVSSVNGISPSYTNNSISITIPELDCLDEGYYDCIAVQTDNTEVVAPAQLHIQPKNPPKNVPVTLTMNTDINDYRYLLDKFHSCRGDVGYPENEGYLSITFTHPETQANHTYDKMTITESMKNLLEPPYKFSVNLAGGLNMIILEDNEAENVNCTREKVIKFLLDITGEWNTAVVTCSVKTENDEIIATVVEEEIYVIPKSICDGTNGSDTYLPHEKIDNCKSYIRCASNVPTGLICRDSLYFNHLTNVCDWDFNVVCNSEMTTTTQGSTESATATPIQSTTPAFLCPIESCTSDSVFVSDTATISCRMNTSASYKMISVKKNSDTLLTIYSNHTVVFSVDNSENKFECSVSASLTFTIKNVSCSDSSKYTFSLVAEDDRSCSKSKSLDLKVKPKKPVLEIDYTWEVNKISHHVCSGNVGNPAGTLSLEIRNGTTGNFATYTPSSQSFDPIKVQNCSNYKTLKFTLDFAASNLTGYDIRCAANNADTLESSETSPVSNIVNIYPLPAYPCHKPDGLYPYPGICYLYLNCAGNFTRVQSCNPTDCFIKTDSSGYCGRHR